MDKTPITDHPSDDLDDAPEVVGAHTLQVVPAYETTGQMLASLAAIAVEHAHRNPGDETAADVAKLVTAVEIAHRAGDPDALAWIKRLAAKADHRMRHGPNRGPRTREEQAAMLCSTIETGLRLRREGGWSERQIAARFVTVLRICPDIVTHTDVPSVEVSLDEWRDEWRDYVEADAVHDVDAVIAEALEKAAKKLEAPDAKAITKAALRALGCHDETAQNLCR